MSHVRLDITSRDKRKMAATAPQECMTETIKKGWSECVAARRKGQKITEEHRLARNAYMRITNRGNLRRKLTQLKSNAKTRHILYNLEDEFVLWLLRQPCNYCGSQSVGRVVNGVDRFDPSKGYTVDNVVPCCPVCNYMKLDMTEDEFMTQLRKICLHKEVRLD